MTFHRPTTRREWASWTAIAVAGFVALGARAIEDWRLFSSSGLWTSSFRVTSAADSGAGSLREAILAADRAPGRARVVLAVPRITLETALPPLVNPQGTVLEADASGTVLDGRRIAGPTLDVASATTLVSGIQLVGGSAGVVVRAASVTLQGLRITDTDTGVLVGDDTNALRIIDSVFTRNRIGVHVTTSLGQTTIQNSRFEGAKLAAVWAVASLIQSAPTGRIDVLDSHFRDDAMGVVAINLIARLERNDFDDQQGAAVHSSGGRVLISDNRIRAGRGFGIYAERLESGYIAGNEIARHCSGGILLRDVRNTEVIGNQLYQNGYGLVVMNSSPVGVNTLADNLIADQMGDGLLLIGGSPITSGNHVLRNRGAGVRLSSLRLPSGVWAAASPRLTGNVVSGNGHDELRDEYVTKAAPAETPTGDGDCTWRLARRPVAVSAGVGGR